MRKHKWHTLQVVVEVKVQGDDYKTKDLRWHVERAIEAYQLPWAVNRYRQTPIAFGRVVVKELRRIIAARKISDDETRNRGEPLRG